MNKTMMLSMGVAAVAASSFAIAANVSATATPDVAAVKAIAAQENIITAVQTSNHDTADLKRGDITNLDQQWRQQISQGSGALISQTMESETAKALKKTVADSQGQYSGALLMNDKGLSVAQTYETKTYSQYTRNVWKKTYRVGADAVYVSRGRRDGEIKQRYITIAVPVVGKQHQVIGALAVDVQKDS